MQMETYAGCGAGCAGCPRRQLCFGRETPLEAFERDNPGQGTLRIQAFRGPQTLPVEGVQVVVSHTFADGTSHIYFTGVTDESGLIDSISLPAPALSQSLHPGDAHPSAVYTVRSKADGFVPMENTVDIFQGIKTVQPLQLRLE